MNITFSDGTHTVVVRAPQYGYSTVIHMGLHYAKYPGGYGIWDDGVSYDWRQCKIPSWLLSSSEQGLILEFLHNMLKARGNTFSLILGSSHTGFFPFGPDFGDTGTFVCETVDYTEGGVQYDPLLWFGNVIALQYVSKTTSYTLPDAENEGELQIGTVTTLRYLQQPATPTHHEVMKVQQSRAGVITSTDLGNEADNFETDFQLLMKIGNACALINYLTVTGRGNYIPITFPENTYLFGGDSSTTWASCQLLNNELEIVHESFNLFSLKLKFTYDGSLA